jgi:very-short-patch-repair endonuclease
MRAARRKSAKPKKQSSRVRRYLKKTELAREMRLNPSPPESILWGHLQYRFPRVFHRQMVMCGYIADFYAPNHQLVVEVDGNRHLAPKAQEYDSIRNKAMEKRGFKVVRFPANKVLNEIETVLAQIAAWITTKPSPVASLEGSLVGARVTVRPQLRNEAQSRNP